MKNSPLGLLRVKVVALGVSDAERACAFYGGTLSLPPAYEGEELVGYTLGDTLFMLKADGSAQPSATPNPRITLEVEDARRTEAALRERGVVISDPVQLYDGYPVGGFLDSEGNKLWFCSEPESG